MADNFYRQNVATIILNEDNLVFLGKRLNEKGAFWQFPQGGVDKNEGIIDACFREIEEETGILSNKLELLYQLPEKIKYNFPQWVLDDMKKQNRPEWNGLIGQEQTWFLLKFLGNESDVNLKHSQEQEFVDYKWETFDFAIENCIDFKKDVYFNVINKFKAFLEIKPN